MSKSELDLYTVVDVIPVEEVFAKIDYHVENRTKGKAEYNGNKFNVKSIRLAVFRNKGLQCAHCDRVGDHFNLEYHTHAKGDNANPHLNLYSADGMLFTKDHILPKSKGGKDTLSNLQTMCFECNTLKGNSYEQS